MWFLHWSNNQKFKVSFPSLIWRANFPHPTPIKELSVSGMLKMLEKLFDLGNVVFCDGVWKCINAFIFTVTEQSQQTSPVCEENKR